MISLLEGLSNIRYCLFGMALFIAACNGTDLSGDRSAGAAQRKPNVILIYMDDLGYGDLSCYGATRIRTPNVDKLAAQGLRLTNGHATASTCTPSRYSILTGEYAFRNKKAQILPGNASLLVGQGQATLGTIFQEAGYHTACIGKWHIGLGPAGGPDWNGDIKPGPNEVGFDYSFIFPATADRVPTVYMENHRVVALDPRDPIAVSYAHKIGDRPTGRKHPELLKLKPSVGHDGTIVNGISRIGWMTGGLRALWTDEELAPDFFEQARSFIVRNQDHPFFLYYAMNEIHVPRMPNTRFKGKSELGYRGDVILEMDYYVGRLLQTLDALHLAEKTLIVFTSDNGPVLDDGYADGAVAKALGRWQPGSSNAAEAAVDTMGRLSVYQPSGPYRGGKYSLYEGGTRVPFIVKWPGVVQAGATSDALVGQVDLLASFAALLDVKPGAGTGIDSRNLLDTFLGKAEKGRESLVEQNNEGAVALVKDGWKYIAPQEGLAEIDWAKNGSGFIPSGLSMDSQLYHLSADTGEQQNLASKYPEKVSQMAKELQQIVARQDKPE